MLNFIAISFWIMVIFLTIGAGLALASGFGAPIAPWITISSIILGTAGLLGVIGALIVHQSRSSS